MCNHKVIQSMLFLTSLTFLGMVSCTGVKETPVTPVIEVTQTIAVSSTLQGATPVLSQTSTTKPTVIATPASTTVTVIPVTGMNTPSPVSITISLTPLSILSCADQAKAGRPLDVNIPDDTEMEPGQEFSKTWRLINNGTCTWTSDYAVVWVYGEKMGIADAFPLPTSVAPGEQEDLSVDMAAPQSPGIYQSNWKLRNASGVIFGVGPGEGLYFYVRIRVVGTPVPTPAEGLSITMTPTVAVRASGPTRLLVKDRIDLDNNQINPTEGSDMAFTSGGGKYLLIPMEKATFSIFGRSEPTLQECQAASLDASAIYVDDKSAGTYLCCRTGLGLAGWVRLTRFWPDKAMLNLEIHTWDLP